MRNNRSSLSSLTSAIKPHPLPLPTLHDLIGERGSGDAQRKAILPGCCLHVCSLEDQTQGVALPATTAQYVRLDSGWAHVGRVGTPLFPWLSYHTVLLLTPVLCHLRGPEITRCPGPPEATHTNSRILSFCLSLSLAFSGAS